MFSGGNRRQGLVLPMMTMRPLFLVLCLVNLVVAKLGPPMCGWHREPEVGPREEEGDLSAERFWNEYVRKVNVVVDECGSLL